MAVPTLSSATVREDVQRFLASIRGGQHHPSLDAETPDLGGQPSIFVLQKRSHNSDAFLVKDVTSEWERESADRKRSRMSLSLRFCSCVVLSTQVKLDEIVRDVLERHLVDDDAEFCWQLQERTILLRAVGEQHPGDDARVAVSARATKTWRSNELVYLGVCLVCGDVVKINAWSL